MKGKSIAIIGSGPAGIAAAMRLADAGFLVTVFERLPVFGGMLAYGIPEFRIGAQSVKNKVKAAMERGVRFVKRDILSVKAVAEEFDFVLLAIGAGESAEMCIKCEKINGVMNALDLLYAWKVDGKAMVGKDERVAVIGGGNAAIDAARTAARQGAKATVVYRRTENEMPAYAKETQDAKNEGVNFEFLLTPTEFIGKEKLEGIRLAKMQLSNPDETGRKRPIPTGGMVEESFDRAIIAIGQNQELAWLEKEGIETVNSYTVKVNGECKTSLDGVYAAGDCVTGAKTIAEAVKTGLAAADGIMAANKE